MRIKRRGMIGRSRLLGYLAVVVLGIVMTLGAIQYWDGSAWVLGDASAPAAVLSATKTVTFTGAAFAGAVGTVGVFSVTGDVEIIRLASRCTVSLVSAGGGTLLLGVVGATTLFIASTVATALTTSAPWWFSATPTGGGRAIATALTNSVISGNVIITVGTADVTAGAIRFDVLWRPLSAGSSLVAA